MCLYVFVSACTLVYVRGKEKHRYDFMTSSIYLLVLDISSCTAIFNHCRNFSAQRCSNITAEQLTLVVCQP